MTQELITSELAGKIREYEQSVLRWQSTQAVSRRGALYAVAIAIPLWAVSYFASAETGPVNQAAWLTAITFFAFIGALISTIAAMILSGFTVMNDKPSKPVLQVGPDGRRVRESD